MLPVAGAADSSLVALERLHARESGGRTLAGASPRATTGDRSASDAFAAELASEDQPRAPQVPAAASAITSCAGQTCVCLLQENSVMPHLLLASEDAMTCGSCPSNVICVCRLSTSHGSRMPGMCRTSRLLKAAVF